MNIFHSLDEPILQVMTVQLKKDIRTIFEVLTYIGVFFCVSHLLSGSTWLAILWSILYIGGYVYYYFTIKKRKDICLFPTQNDEYSKMTIISFGVIIMIIAILSYFVADINIYYAFIGLAIGIIMILAGSNEPTKGWIQIKENVLEIYGVQEKMDTRQLKEIILKNDKITLTSIYGEQTSSFNLKLNPSAAQVVKSFLIENLTDNEILINDLVANEL